MKKMCFVTAARSEYGLLKWLMSDVDKCDEFELQIIVTGGHLSYEQGHTVDHIIEDGFGITCTVDVGLDTSSTARIAESMARMAEGFAKAFEEMKPDYLVVLGDRYELLPICNMAFVMRIPIIHISGGDITEGAIDDGIRNAVTMLASYHFPGTRGAADNIIRMRGSEENIWAVGEPGLDSFNRETMLNRKELAVNLNLDENKKWGLMTYHAETKESMEYNLCSVEMCIEALVQQDDFQTIITYANADFGGKQINEFIEKKAQKYADKIKVIPSMGNIRYLSFMHQASFVIGNSSSGIVEAPFLNIPVINIGNRQKGRHLCDNIYQCNPTKSEITKAIHEITDGKYIMAKDLNYWGDGHTSEKILQILKKELF